MTILPGVAVSYLGRTYRGGSPTKSGSKESKLYGLKPNISMGVNMFVNSPADQTNNNESNNKTTNTTLKITPFDFTIQQRKFKTFQLVSRVRDIMNAIQGPKVMDINIHKANDINKITSADGTASFPPLPSTMNAINARLWKIAYSYSDLNFSFIPQEFLKVRRDGENANAMTAVETMTATYDQQASQVTNNAPSDSMYHYPFIFSNYTINPTVRPLCIKPILDHWWLSYTAPSSPPNVQVLKLNTLNTNIRSSTNFPGATVPFPNNCVAIDCSTLTTTNIGKLYKLSPYIIDVSNTHEGAFAAVSSTVDDANIARALDKTMTSQDIEFALFLGNYYLTNNRTSNVNTDLALHNYKYDPVEAIFSYLSTKKYEFTDNTLSNMISNSNFGANLILSYRLASTYLVQQAAKMMRIWLSPAVVLTNNTYSANQINNALQFNVSNDLTKTDSNGAYVYWPIWIPYEYVYSSNNTIEFDKTTWVSGKGNRKIAKFCVKPRSFTSVHTSLPASYTYYHKYGQGISFTFNDLTTTIPISIYSEDLNDRCIHSVQSWNDDNILDACYLEESDYFPAPDLELNI